MCAVRRALPVILLGVALSTRLSGAIFIGETLHFADEAAYVDTALRMRAGEGFGNTYDRVPAYPIFLAFTSLAWSTDVLFLRLAQAAVTATGVLLVFALTRRLFGFAPAVAAALIYALDPLLVVAGGLLYPEGVAALVFLGLALLAGEALRTDRLGPWGGSGALIGILSQLRPVALILAPVMILWALSHRGTFGRRVLRAGMVATMFILLLLPWTYRNYVVHGKLVPVATAGQRAAPVPQEDLARQGLAGSLARQASTQPLMLLRHVLRQFGHFWEFYPTRLATDRAEARARFHERDPRLPIESSFDASWRDRVSAWSFAPELLAAAIGLGVGWWRRPRETALLVTLVLAYALGFSLVVAKLRYRIPVLPEVFVFSGLGVVWTLQRLTGRPDA